MRAWGIGLEELASPQFNFWHFCIDTVIVLIHLLAILYTSTYYNNNNIETTNDLSSSGNLASNYVPLSLFIVHSECKFLLKIIINSTVVYFECHCKKSCKYSARFSLNKVPIFLGNIFTLNMWILQMLLALLSYQYKIVSSHLLSV